MNQTFQFPMWSLERDLKDMIHCTLICNLVELCPERSTFSPLAMKGVHMSSSMEMMVQMVEVKLKINLTPGLAGRLSWGLGLQMGNWKRQY